MTQIITTIITAATEAGQGLASALVQTFESIAYSTTGETTVMTSLFETMLVFVGFSLACGLLAKAFSLIRSKLRRKA